jgi:hypothetical protein
MTVEADQADLLHSRQAEAALALVSISSRASRVSVLLTQSPRSRGSPKAPGCSAATSLRGSQLRGSVGTVESPSTRATTGRPGRRDSASRRSREAHGCCPRGKRNDQSMPKRLKTGAWNKAASSAREVTICREIKHSPPHPYTPLLNAGVVWGTRGPEFKSRRPDYEEVAGKANVLAQAAQAVEPEASPDPRLNASLNAASSLGVFASFADDKANLVAGFHFEPRWRRCGLDLARFLRTQLRGGRAEPETRQALLGKCAFSSLLL